MMASQLEAIWSLVDSGRNQLRSALPLIEKALEEGERDAYNPFSWIEPALEVGDIGSVDEQEEFDQIRLRILHKAASICVSSACYNLALEYEEGSKIPQDGEKAFNYMSSAAALDHVGACYKLASYLLHGVGCQICVQNKREAAIIYYHLAFSLSHIGALLELAIMSLQGVALPKDASFAFILASCAKSFGAEDSQNLLNKIEEGLSADDKAAAETLACTHSSLRHLKIFGAFPKWITSEPEFYKLALEAEIRHKVRIERTTNAARFLLSVLPNTDDKNNKPKDTQT